MAVELLCVGLTTLDVAAHPVDELPADDAVALVEHAALAPAGTAGGTALVAARLGVRTALASLVGADAAGHAVRMLLELEGIDTRLLGTHAALPTSTTLILIRSSGQRPRLHALGASMVAEASEAVIAAARQARYVHYAGIGGARLDGGPGAELVAAAKAAGATVTCDLISPRPGAADELKRLLPHVDYFLPNAGEARQLAGADSLAAAGQHFRELGARICVIKDGERGSLFVGPQGSVRLPAHAVVPVDTTSCGDSYCAGFIAALARGRSELDACRFGTATAARVAEGLGTLGRLEDFAATDRYRATMPLRETPDAR
jgi:sugar/nucleoside kinase (ribokinase family)